MSPQELAALLCEEGDQHLCQQDLPGATAFYLAAFSCCSSTALQKVNSVSAGQRQQVMATLEAWCQGEGRIPKIQSRNLAVVSLSVGMAEVFLSSLSPSNAASAVAELEALLRRGCSEEVVSRCDVLLRADPGHPGDVLLRADPGRPCDVLLHADPRHPCDVLLRADPRHPSDVLLRADPGHPVELLLLRALALALVGTRDREAVTEYVRAFVLHGAEAAGYVRSRQRGHLPQILHTFSKYLSAGQKESPDCSSLDRWLGNCYGFLSAVAPGDIWVCRAQAAYLLKTGQFQECVPVCTKALEGFSAERLREETVLGLLLERAAAYFFLGGWMQEMVQDLTEAFAANPAQAMRHFEGLFSPRDAEKVEEQARAVLEAKFAAYREAVRARAELRGNHGTELLPPVIQTIQFLLQLCPGSQRELSVRLADCQLLQGHPEAALGICDQLLAAEQNTYHNTLLALRGFCSLHTQDHQRALQDFQKVIEHDSPHPNSCIKALCGRGLIRISGGSSYLAALDYVTACQLKLEETIFTVKSYVPWNQRGLLLKVLQEEGQRMLQKKRDAPGVFQLGRLLVELDTGDEASRVLCADALYQMGCAEEAHGLLSLALSRNPHGAPVLARLALLQLKKGFVHDGNQLLQRVIRTGDTSCLLPIMDIFKDEDRKLMQTHCHFQALAILKSQEEDVHIKEAIAYLSFAIIAAGGDAGDCLLSRARCYGRLGQMKTAIFDFNAILKEDPRNVQALSGRGFVFLALRQQKEAVQDLVSALKVEAGAVIPAILSLKAEVQALVTGWLLQHGRAVLTQLVASKDLPKGETLRDLLTVAKALIKIRQAAQHHVFYTDVLMANGRYEEALAHLQAAFGHCPAEDFARARLAVLQLKRRDVAGAAHSFSILAQRDEKELEFLLSFTDTKQRQQLAQVASQEGQALMKGQQYEQALGYLSVAVVAGRASARFLRRRATCLQLLGRYESALGDMDRVIQGHGHHSAGTRAQDLCSKGHLLLAVAREDAAVRHYLRALQLDRAAALGTIARCPGTQALSSACHRIAQRNLERRRYQEAWEVTDCGLRIQKTAELQRLKARLKREASGCSIH